MFFKRKEDEEEELKAAEKAKANQAKPLVATGAQGTTASVAAVVSPTPSPAIAQNAKTSVSGTVFAPNPVAASSEASTDVIAERFGKIRSALGPGTIIQGKLSFDTPVSIDGKLSGEVYSSKALIVGRQGVVEAKLLEVATLVVLGTVKGSVKASEGIELLKGGRIEGQVITPRLLVEEGAFFDGTCQMPSSVSMSAGIAKPEANKQPQGQKPAGQATATGENGHATV